MKRRAFPAIVSALLTLASPVLAQTEAVRRLPHVRSEDPSLMDLLGRGRSRSLTLRAVVDRLEASDVVAYLGCDLNAPSGLGGRLSYVSTAAGLRYVLARIDCSQGRPTQLALIGHELWHAVEVAEAADVIDAASMERLYRRIGIATRVPGIVNGVDSETAIAIGGRVATEIASSGPSDTKPRRVRGDSRPPQGRAPLTSADSH